MSVVLETRGAPVEAAWAHERLLDASWVRLIRLFVWRAVLGPITRWYCAPLFVRGREHVPSGPVIFVANHASHADTLALLRALPPHVRRRTAPAAAEDYFFRGWARATFSTIVIGAFPFPRRSGVGLVRASSLLDRGRSVIVFPEGTRSIDGRVATFKPGIGVLARAGATVVPVGISGTAQVLAKGGSFPRRAPVAVVFGAPLVFDGQPVEHATAVLERNVKRLAAQAALSRRPARRTAFARARALAFSRAGLWLAFCWGVAEALAWSIVPDLAVALLAVAAPRRFVKLAAAAVAGSLCGGGLAYVVGPVFLHDLPLVTERMIQTTDGWLHAEGAHAVARQPWSGVPFKAFAYQAQGAQVPIVPFLYETLLARGARFLEVATVFAVVGTAARRIAPRVYGPFAVLVVGVFTVGLVRVVSIWS